MYRTEYTDDRLTIENGTEPREIHEFVVSRATDPHAVDGILVWNFNNHKLNKTALSEKSGDLMNDEYVVPHQASGAWGYMISLLPERIKTAETLTYSQWDGEYNPYPNYYRHVEEKEHDSIRNRISESLEDSGI